MIIVEAVNYDDKGDGSNDDNIKMTILWQSWQTDNNNTYITVLKIDTYNDKDANVSDDNYIDSDKFTNDDSDCSCHLPWLTVIMSTSFPITS